MKPFLQQLNRGRWHCLPLLLALAGGPLHGAENSEDAQQELAGVGDAIEEIQSWLVEARTAQSEERDALQRLELEISSLIQTAAETEQELATTEAEIDALTEQSTSLHAEQLAQSNILEQAVRSAYLTGDQSSIELLLNQTDLSKAARMLHYHKLFTESQLSTIAEYQETLDNIVLVNSQLEAEAAELAAQQQTLNETQARLDTSKQQRELALNELRDNIASRSEELEQLEIDQTQLQALIEEINRAVADIPAAMERTPFASQRGSLQMPVAGEIVNRYGSRYGEGDLKRQGVTIRVSEGTPVQAIHPGRVVFSDWLRGTGLLVIVDHGQGYMSLYGANQALSKQAGDWVNAGDVVATSGFSSDLSRSQDGGRVPGMYFEIRHHGESQDPADWFSR